MIIKQLIMKEGMNSSNDVFSEKRNLLFSTENTKGKTTFIRALFFALGYSIPNIKGINYSSIETTMVLVEKDREYIVERTGDQLQLTVEKRIMIFTLPSEHNAFLSYIFQYDNIKVLSNLLGFLYIDQDKGWSLLNRGTVVGKIKFNIEELLSGVNNVDITELLETKRRLMNEKNKYSALLSIQELSEQVYEKNGEIFLSDIEKEYSDRIAFLNLKISNLNNSLKEVNKAIRDEKCFFSYIESMRLLVEGPDGNTIPVSKKNIVSAYESTEFLKARRSILIIEIEKLKREKQEIESKLFDYSVRNSEQLSFTTQEDYYQVIDKELATISSKIDHNLILELLNRTKSELKQTNSEIERLVKNDNKFIAEIYDYVLKYATKLGIEKKIVHKENYIFTSDLKSMSGAVLQKMVFAFKVAFLKVIEEAMGTKLFMVIDSPKSKELDEKNTDLIMQLIKDELCNNQVFIASIYDFESEKKIIIDSRAIEER